MNEPASTQYPSILASVASESILASPPGLLDFLPVGCYACDASGKVRWFNEKAAEFWGRRPSIGDDSEKYCGSYKLFSLDGTVIRREQTPMAHVLKTGEPISGGTATVERPDGTMMVAMVHIEPLKDAAGNLIGAINCFHDITEVKESERRYRLSEQYLRDLLNALPAAIYTTDAQGHVTFYNEAAVALAGRRPQIGTDQWCVSWELYTVQGARLPHDQCPMAIALKENREIRGVEAILKRPDGTFVPFLPYPTPLHDTDGRLAGAVNVLVDISQHKQHEKTQQLLFSELNHRVKNNLQMLQALFNAAVRETTNIEARDVIKQAAQKVAAISAAQRALYQANLASQVAARTFLEAICECMRETLPQGVRVEYRAEDFAITNDATVPLALIINELVTNAGKYAIDSDGEARVLIDLSFADQRCTLRIADSGCGLVSEQSNKRASGLGLVRGLVAQLAGNMSLESGTGATWTISFPLHAIPASSS